MRCRTLTSRAGRFRAAQVLGSDRTRPPELVPRWAPAASSWNHSRNGLHVAGPSGASNRLADLVHRPGWPIVEPNGYPCILYSPSVWRTGAIRANRPGRTPRRERSRRTAPFAGDRSAQRSRALEVCSSAPSQAALGPIAPARAAAAARHPGKRGWHCPAAPRNAQCPRRRGLMPGSFHNIPGRPPVGRGTSHWGEARRDTVHCGLRQLCYAART